MLRELFERQRPLMIAGIVFLIGGFVMASLMLVDDGQILGINRWIKPMKFYISTTIFLWTIAILLNYLRGYTWFLRTVSWSMVVIFVIEMAAVTGQAAHGTTSHFNRENSQGALIFAIMGLAILLNTCLVAAILVAYFRSNTGLSPTLLWGIRLGLMLFLAGSMEGGYMSATFGHTVGAIDGGPGLPLTNWSTVAGDLRVAHFLGLHSLQAIPLFALLTDRFGFSRTPTFTVAFAGVYFVFFMLLFLQALLGQSLIRL